ncbi:GTPase [Campylobacter concisus]|uniref:GTPase n=3 Tax=Campylobacter concisus TaxID=199 RepID=UPI001650211A|nr:GTPase domain-containing protein [Campylobacter concisus]
MGIACNVLIIGKTGTGKSSFANYLFDVDKFTTGSGEPVTSWAENFQAYHFEKEGIKINVYDSVGLEPDNQSKWMGELDKFLAQKQKQNDLNKIIHALFYVTNASSARIEPGEITKIKDIKQKYDIDGTIVFTHCDVADDDTLCQLEKNCKQNNLKSIKICSISRKTRTGAQSQKYGKDEAVKILLNSSHEKIGRKLNEAVCDNVIEHLLVIREKIEENVFIFDFLLLLKLQTSYIIPRSYVPYKNFLDQFPQEYTKFSFFYKNLKYIRCNIFILIFLLISFCLILSIPVLIVFLFSVLFKLNMEVIYENLIKFIVSIVDFFIKRIILRKYIVNNSKVKVDTNEIYKHEAMKDYKEIFLDIENIQFEKYICDEVVGIMESLISIFFSSEDELLFPENRYLCKLFDNMDQA